MTNITLNEVWDRIAATQNQLESLDKILFKVQCVEASAQYVSMENEDSEHCGEPLEYCSEVALKKIQTIKEIACTREQTLKQLLDFYIHVYEDTKSANIDK